jgi:hypothetical protein
MASKPWRLTICGARKFWNFAASAPASAARWINRTARSSDPS